MGPSGLEVHYVHVGQILKQTLQTTKIWVFSPGPTHYIPQSATLTCSHVPGARNILSPKFHPGHMKSH